MGDHHTDRLHALDAVRAYALILGVFLHATMAFLANLPPGLWVYTDTPSDTLAGVFFVIHMFRMSAFFLIAGFFARMVLERRGIGAFAKDRLKRIGIPLVIGLPIILATIIGAYIAAGLMVGIDLAAAAEAQVDAEIPPGYFPWAHLWFLYYLLLFYAIALILRSVLHTLDRHRALSRLADRLVQFILRRRPVVFGGGIWGVIILARPLS